MRARQWPQKPAIGTPPATRSIHGRSLNSAAHPTADSAASATHSDGHTRITLISPAGQSTGEHLAEGQPEKKSPSSSNCTIAVRPATGTAVPATRSTPRSSSPKARNSSMRLARRMTSRSFTVDGIMANSGELFPRQKLDFDFEHLWPREHIDQPVQHPVHAVVHVPAQPVEHTQQRTHPRQRLVGKPLRLVVRLNNGRIFPDGSLITVFRPLPLPWLQEIAR